MRVEPVLERNWCAGQAGMRACGANLDLRNQASRRLGAVVVLSQNDLQGYPPVARTREEANFQHVICRSPETVTSRGKAVRHA